MDDFQCGLLRFIWFLLPVGMFLGMIWVVEMMVGGNGYLVLSFE